MITIWSDLRCPWAYVAVIRLHRMRDHLRADRVEFEHRAYPLELADRSRLDGRRMTGEIVALAQLEPTAFSSYPNESWPTTYLPAFEAQKWGFSLGQDIGERFDLALRRAFFLHGHNLSLRHEILAVADAEGLGSDQLAAALDDGRFRKAVMADYVEATDLAIEGSPQVVLPDGTTHLNPGIGYRVSRGIPIIESDHPSVYEELIQVAAIED